MPRLLLIFCLLALLVWGGASAWQAAPTATPSIATRVAGTQTALAPLDIRFEGVYPLAVELRDPVRTALEANRDLLDGGRYTVSAYRDIPGWAKVTLVPSAVVESGWQNVETVTPAEVILRETVPRAWVGYVVGGARFIEVLRGIPESFVDYITPPQIEGAYRLPWQSGQGWWLTQDWHDGSALDFQPTPGARFGVLAAQAGWLRELCSDGYQSLLQIAHGDGRSTYYLHVRLGLAVRRSLLDQVVRQGQYLGELIDQQRFRTPCGQGNSRHLHFAVSDRNTVIEGTTLAEMIAAVPCCDPPPIFQSTNERVDDSAR
jgi:murein DD-endopeptidase MepM/ murein hydrolase activator NlpD